MNKGNFPVEKWDFDYAQAADLLHILSQKAYSPDWKGPKATGRKAGPRPQGGKPCKAGFEIFYL